MKRLHFRYIFGALPLLGLLYPGQGKAQIAAPDFICVTNDTLVWELPVNNCGPFISYQIFAAQDPDGPFNLLTTIGNPAQTRFFNPAAQGQTWYYYLQSQYDCPGQPPVPSDTLDNLIPESSPLHYVTVNAGNSVEVSWSLSPSPETIGYIISRQNASGTTILDTVFSGNTFLDLTPEPDIQPETYFVTAIDQCGNASLVPPPHQTIFLEAGATDPCNQSMELAWTTYRGWNEGVARYEVWVSANSGPFNLDGTTVNPSYTFLNARDGDNYCFYIRAIQNQGPFVSRSNTVCQTLEVFQPVDELAILEVSVTGDNQVDIRWFWDITADISEGSLLRINPGEDIPTPVSIIDPAAPRTPENLFSDQGAFPAAGPVIYRVQTVDACDKPVSSNTVSTVFLSGSNSGGTRNRLEWTIYLGDVTSYKVFRIDDNGFVEEVASLSPGERTYEDLIDLSNAALRNACYYVEATGTVTLNSGEERGFISRSNVICLEQSPEIFVPNAFAPDGKNRVFRPVLQFGTPASYSLAIYDRWGGMIFESKSLTEGWDGRHEGRPLPQGVYLYRLLMTRADGKEVEKRGVVFLLR